MIKQDLYRRTAAWFSALPAGIGACAFVAVALSAAAAAIPSSHLPRPPSPRSRATREPIEVTGAQRVAQPVGRAGPIGFEPGACLSFPPTVNWNGSTVFLDPGHGGVDPGAMAQFAGRTVTEKQLTLAVGLRALSLLRSSGYRVVMSRVGDSTVATLRPLDLHQGVLAPDAARREIEARNLCADAAHADVLVGVHMNAFADPSVRGTETFYCPGRPFAARSRRLAGLIQRSTVVALRGLGVGAVNRGVLPDSAGGGSPLTAETANYHHLIQLGPQDRPWLPYPSLMPGVLVEPVFLSNPTEAALVLSAHGQRALAQALLNALESYFGRAGAA